MQAEGRPDADLTLPSFCSTATLLPSRPARQPRRRAQARVKAGRRSRLAAHANTARPRLDGRRSTAARCRATGRGWVLKATGAQCFHFPFAIGSRGNGNRKRRLVYDLASSIMSIATSLSTVSTHNIGREGDHCMIDIRAVPLPEFDAFTDEGMAKIVDSRCGVTTAADPA